MTQEKMARKLLRKAYGRRPAKPILPLQEDSRHRWREDGESGYEYGFLPFGDMSGWTDEEVQEFVDDEMWICINSPYDCTGQVFTHWINWHRNPNGMISFIHCKGLDV